MTKKKQPEKYTRLMYFGMFLLFPILFLGNEARGTLWFDIFGISALIGVAIEIYAFIKYLGARK
jgi:hypothetical protein